MKWYWWVLIAAGVAAAGWLKLKLWNRIKRNRARKAELEED